MSTKSTSFELFRYQLLPIDRFLQGNLLTGVGSIDELISRKNEFFSEAIRGTKNFSDKRHQTITKKLYEEDDFFLVRMHKFPESSEEYFPPPAIMKATLKSSFFPEQARASLQRDYGQVKAESAAYHLLDYVGHLFIQNSKPDMGGWCLAARDTLEAHVR